MARRTNVTTRPGGQALADGVFMRTGRSWAVARADGSVEAGALPTPAMATVPGARVLTGLTTAFRFSASHGMVGRQGTSLAARRSRLLNRRFLVVLVAAETAMLAASTRLDPAGRPLGWVVLATIVPFLLTLMLIRLAAPAALWRYHGAEHKAVAAYEAGIDLGDLDAVMAVSRIHDRCGTNLVSLLAVAGVVLHPLPLVVQLPAFAVALAASAELLSFAAARPGALATRVLLAPGRLLQRHVTTDEPTRAEMAVGCRALEACLAEHAVLVRADEPAVVDPAAAAPPVAIAV